jgi:hypothetical protein
MNRRWTLLGIAGITLSASLATHSASAAVNAAPVRVTLHRLASNDGRYEASGRPEWVADTGDRLITVTNSDGLDIRSGSRIDLPSSAVVRATSLDPSSLQRGTTVPGVRKQAVLATRRLTVVPLQWTGAAWKSSDRANVDAIIAELVPWWNSMSARQEVLAVKVTDMLDLTSRVAAGSCDIQAMANATRDMLDAKGLDATTDNLMMTFTSDTKECGFAGLGEVGGTTTWTYAGTGYSGVWAHELGHNLGFPHANSCNAGVTLSYMTTCTDVEYGNNADVMGSSNLSSFFSPTFLAQAGFLPAANVNVWTGTSATYTIQRGDRTDLGVTAVRIPATDVAAGDNTFWLQYNPQRIGAVGQSATPANGGIAITMEPSESFAANVIAADGVVGLANSTSYICDLTPSTGDLTARDTTTDPRLAVGRSWTDPRDRFTVTLVSADGTSAVVKVEPVASPSVWAYSTVTATPDTSGLTNMTVSWTPNLTNIGSHEPTRWTVDTPEDGTKACVTSLFEFSCVLTGVNRSSTYTPRVFGTNGAVKSAASVAGTTAVPISPPTFTVAFTSTDTTLTAAVTVGDGGSAVVGTPTIEIAGQPPCALAPNATTSCTFVGLPRRASHVLVAKGTNAVGTREKIFTGATLAGIPETPDLGGKMSGTDLVMTVAPSTMDETNVDYYYVQCTVGNKSWSKLQSADLERSAYGTFRVPAVKGKATWCYAALVSMGTTKQYTSDFGSVKVDAKGKVVAGKLSLSALADDAKKGLVGVKWSVKDSLGKNITVNVTSSKKSCAKKSALSCIIAGLPSGSQIVLRITARGQSGSRSIWKTVTVK